MQTQTDPYNYPFLQKDQTMYLSTISINIFNVQVKMILNQHIHNIVDNQHFKKKIYKVHYQKY